MSSEKARLHPRNKNRERYDLNALSLAIPELKKYIKPNKSGMDSVDFSNPTAVKLLNKAFQNLVSNACACTFYILAANKKPRRLKIAKLRNLVKHSFGCSLHI